MANTLKFGNGVWANKKGSTLAYNDENGNFKPLPFKTTRSTSATRVNKEGLIEVVSNDVPRIDYTDSKDGVFLLEKAATNILPYSEDFSNAAWTKLGTSLTVTSNNVISPSGELNASTINVTNNDNILYESITLSSSSADWVFSIYAKGSGTFDMNVRLNSSTTTTETKTLTSEWQRFNVSVTRTPTITSVECFMELNTSSTYQIWGGQLESGNLSSYIPTQGAASTRSSDTASGSGNSEVFNSEQGVLFADVAANSNGSHFMTLSLNGGSGNHISLLYRGVEDEVWMQTAGGGTNTNIFLYNVKQDDNNKIALYYSSSLIKIYINGFLRGSTTMLALPNSLTTLEFESHLSSEDFYGKTKEIAYYDTVLTDIELETLTSYRSWESMAKELNLNIIHNE